MSKVSYGTITLTDTIDTDLLGGHFIYNGDGAGVIQNIGNGPSNWGFNTWIGSNGIQLRDAATPYATLNAEGLTLSKGGVKANINDPNNRVYISSEDYPRAYYEKTEDTVIDNTKTYYILNDDVFEAVDNPVVEDIENYYNFVPGLVINGYEPISNYDDPAFRLIVGDKFGVDSQGRMYAGNANIQGEITTAAGRIGPWFINASSISRNANGDAAGSYNTASNLYFGTLGLSLGNTFTVNSAGYLTATSGEIGGWTIKPNILSSSTTSTTPGSGVIILSKDVAGPTTDTGVLPANQHWTITASDQFGVTTAGKLYAAGVEVSGAINATSLSTGGRTSTTAAAGTYIDNEGAIYGGNNKFIVTKDGELTATDAELRNVIIYDEDGHKRAAGTSNGFIIYDGANTPNIIASFNGTNGVQIGNDSTIHTIQNTNGLIFYEGSNISGGLTNEATSSSHEMNLSVADLQGDVNTSTGISLETFENPYSNRASCKISTEMGSNGTSIDCYASHFRTLTNSCYIDLYARKGTLSADILIGSLKTSATTSSFGIFLMGHTSPIGYMTPVTSSTSVALLPHNVWTSLTYCHLELSPGTWIVIGTLAAPSASSGRLGARIYNDTDSTIYNIGRVLIPYTTSSAITATAFIEIDDTKDIYLQGYQSSGSQISLNESFIQAIRIV